MLYCEKCGVQIATELKKCPLCQNNLEGDAADGCRRQFPKIKEDRAPGKRAFKIVVLALIAVSLICAAVNFCLPQGGHWSLFVIAGAFTAGLSFAMVIRRRGNILKNIIRQAFIIPTAAVLWDYFTGWHGWSLDYVLPVVCGCAIIATVVIAAAMRLKINECIIYFIIDGIFGVFPLILILCGKVRVVIPSCICAAISLLALAALATVYARPVKDEIVRRLHL